MLNENRTWDIFCHVVDNYGDAGVCWRLARQLVGEYGLQVRLWIDDLAVLHRFCADVEPARARQSCAGITVCRWAEPLPQPLVVAEVVIETFACELPAAYREAMRGRRSLWLNLEYLSAEAWVSGCHGLPSPQGVGGLRKFFFFPGFRPDTGGVLGERGLGQRRRAFQAGAGDDFLRRYGVTVATGALRVSLFAYASAPIAALLQVWAAQAAPIVCYVPEGNALAAAGAFFGEALRAGAVRTRGALTLVALPFLSQDDYDRLLWSCAINFVRGEDSFVRGQWAARPLVWHIYAQPERAHWPKLEAFLELYGAELSPSAARAMRDFWSAWNGEGAVAAAWRAYADALPELHAAAAAWAQRLESGTNLAAALVQFCANQV